VIRYHHTERRANAFFRGGQPFCKLDKVEVRSLDRILTIRHAVAHQSRAARRRFEDEVIGSAAIAAGREDTSGLLAVCIQRGP